MAEKRLRSEGPAFYIANASFYLHGTQLVLAGHTVAAGHPMLKGRLNLFRPFQPTWPLPGAEPEPVGEAVAEPEPEAEP